MSTPDLTTQCHCGAVTLHLPNPPTKVNECRCTVCYKLGALWSHFPRKDVRVMLDLTNNSPRGSLKRSRESADLDGNNDATAGKADSLSERNNNAKSAKDKTSPQQAHFVHSDAVTTAGLDVYLRSDLHNVKGGKNMVAFMRCKRCGSLTHWWGPNDKESKPARIGVNVRLMSEDFVWGDEVERKISRR